MEHLHQIYNSTSRAIIFFDESGTLFEANESATTLLGYSNRYLLFAQSETSFMNNFYSQQDVLDARTRLKDTSRVYIPCVTLRTTSGTKRFASLEIITISNNGKKGRCYLLHDITTFEEKRMHTTPTQ